MSERKPRNPHIADFEKKAAGLSLISASGSPLVIPSHSGGHLHPFDAADLAHLLMPSYKGRQTITQLAESVFHELDGSLVVPPSGLTIADILDLKRFIAMVREIANKVQFFVDPFTNLSKEGMNSHSFENHLDPVVWMVEYLGRMYNLNPWVMAQSALSAATHDIGNVQNRKNHSYHAVAIVKYLFPNLAAQPEFMSDVIEAIILHDDPILENWLEVVRPGGHISDSEDISLMRDHLSPATLLTIASDKLAGLTERPSLKEGEILAENPHRAYWRWGSLHNYELVSGENGNTLVLSMKHNPHPELLPDGTEFSLGRPVWAQLVIRVHIARIKNAVKALSALDNNFGGVEFHFESAGDGRPFIVNVDAPKQSENISIRDPKQILGRPSKKMEPYEETIGTYTRTGD